MICSFLRENEAASNESNHSFKLVMDLVRATTSIEAELADSSKYLNDGPALLLVGYLVPIKLEAILNPITCAISASYQVTPHHDWHRTDKHDQAEFRFFPVQLLSKKSEWGISCACEGLILRRQCGQEAWSRIGMAKIESTQIKSCETIPTGQSQYGLSLEDFDHPWMPSSKDQRQEFWLV